MAITISGANNVDKILATDGVLDSISGFNVVGVMTAGTFDVTGKTTTGHLNIGSNIQLGNAGVVTATTFTGNLTGNVNATSNLLLQIGGSEKFRVASSGQLGIGGANYGSAGQVLTSGGSGSAATWSTIYTDLIQEGNTQAEVVDTGSDGHFKVITEGGERLRVSADGNVTVGAAVTISPVGNINATGIVTATSFSGSGANLTSLPAQATIANNADNRVITGGSGVNLNGEANMRFDGATLTVDGTTTDTPLILTSTNVSGSHMRFQKDGSNKHFVGSGGGFGLGDVDDLSLRTVDNIIFGVGTSEKVRIRSDGKVVIGTNYTGGTLSVTGNLITDDGTNGRVTIQADGTSTNQILSTTTGFGSYCNMKYQAADHIFLYGGTERLRITSGGKVGINSTTPQQALDVRGSINGGSVNQPFLRFHDSHGNQRTTKHYFRCTKGGTSTFDILTVDLNTNFHQALIILYYGARIQNVADSVTYPVNKVMGVNRFNGGAVQFTKNTIVQDGNASTHANIDVVATSSTQYRIRLTFSGTAGGSSFAAGYVEIIGLGPGTDGAFYSLAHGYGITR